MRGAFRGMFRFGCSSAYSTHSYQVLPPSIAQELTENPEFRSYLHSLTSQTAAPRQEDESPRLTSRVNAQGWTDKEIYPGVRMGEQSFDVTVLMAIFGVILTIGLGGCFVLGWVVDNQAKAARLQMAQEYARQHPALVQELMPPAGTATYYVQQAPQTVPAEFGRPARQYVSDAASGGMPQNAQPYMYWR